MTEPLGRDSLDRVHEILHESDLPPGPYHLMLALTTRPVRKDGVIQIPVRRMADEAKMSVSSVMVHLKLLKAEGWLEILPWEPGEARRYELGTILRVRQIDGISTALTQALVATSGVSEDADDGDVS